MLRSFKVKISIEKYTNKRTTLINKEFDTIEDAREWLVEVYDDA